MVFVSVGGHEVGREDDPLCIVPAQPVDAPAVQGPFSGARREDAQLWSFLGVLSCAGLANNPLTVHLPEAGDPPDRILASPTVTWNLELTQISLGDVLKNVAVVRQLGRAVEKQIKEEWADYAHLRGRRATLSVLDLAKLPRRTAPLVAEICDALREDRGYVGEGLDLSNGLPDQIPGDARGFYGNHGPVIVQVDQIPEAPEAFLAVSSTQAQFHRSEAMAALQRAVSEKDDVRNNVVLVTCGLPDSHGFLCPMDFFLFEEVAQTIASGYKVQPPQHLHGVVLHHWPTGRLTEVWEREDTMLPWRRL